MIKRYNLIFLVLCFFIMITCTINNDVFILKNVKIIQYSENPPFASGIRVTWIEISIQDRHGGIDHVYTPYLMQETKLPQIGLHYDLYCHFEDIDGFVGPKPRKINKAKILDKFILLK